MTIKVFWQDPYLTELEIIVKAVNGNQITVNETIFCAFSGGQENEKILDKLGVKKIGIQSPINAKDTKFNRLFYHEQEALITDK